MKLYRYLPAEGPYIWEIQGKSESESRKNWKPHELRSAENLHQILRFSRFRFCPLKYLNDLFEASPIFVFRNKQKFEALMPQIPNHLHQSMANALAFFDDHDIGSNFMSQYMKGINEDQYSGQFFTANPFSPIMWGHYARSGKGICVEFETSSAIVHCQEATSIVSCQIDTIDKIFRKVTYIDERPTIDCWEMLLTMENNHASEDYMRRVFFTKHKDWSYEDEYRVLFHGIEGELEMSITNIILGPKFDIEIKSKLIDSYPNQVFIQSTLSKTEYKVEF